jgi:hypothetical protein
MRYCPICRSEYQDWVKACLDCASPLKDGPAPLAAAQEAEFGEGAAITSQSPGEEPYETEDKVEDYVDEVIETADFLNPSGEDEYGEPVEDVPRAQLISVLQSIPEETVKKASVVLHGAGIKIYLLKKAGVFSHFYVLMVETADSEKALQILKETDNGDLVPLEPGVEDPELKDAPVINLDLEEAKKGSSKQIDEGDAEVVICPVCDSSDIQFKSAFFSSKVKLKCRACGHGWQA